MAKTLDQICEREEFNRGFAAAKRAAIAICNEEQRLAIQRQTEFGEGIACGAAKCSERIQKLETPQKHED